MAKVYAALSGPPWHFHPDQIARLTDQQIEEQYLRPENERREAEQRAIEDSRNGRPDLSQDGMKPEVETDELGNPIPPDLETMARHMDAELGMGVEFWKAKIRSRGYQ